MKAREEFPALARKAAAHDDVELLGQDGEYDQGDKDASAALAKIDHLQSLLAEMTAEVARLTAWKQEAIAVLAEWDACYDVLAAAGRPAPLGAIKARHVRAEIARLT